MVSRPIRLAVGIIKASNVQEPADAVLRRRLPRERDLSAAEARQTTQAVFAYYRWRGWLDGGAALEAQVGQAVELSQRFARQPASFPDAELVERAVPTWLHAEMEISPAWVRALQAEPRVWLRARPGQGAELARRLRHCRAFGDGPLADVLEYQGREDLFRTAEFHAGAFELQDLNSQAIGFIAAPQPGETWWDACAGEGGKTLHLSTLMQNRGLIWASDRAEWRLQKLKRRAARAGVFNYRHAPWAGGAVLPTRTKFDGVLVDAPCSGIGTWHRNPHARWTVTPEAIGELGQLQQRLLAHAAPAVKPGGRLLYAVCTPARSETITIVEAFNQACVGYEPLLLQDPFQPGSAAVHGLYLWPQQFGGNGMFVAGWTRSG